MVKNVNKERQISRNVSEVEVIEPIEVKPKKRKRKKR